MYTLSWTKMKVSGAQAWLLLLFLVQTDRNQVSAQCSVPTVLCCAGTNSGCYRGCYCDEFCVTNRDCCADYIQTCKPLSSPSSESTTSPTTQSSSSSPPSSPTTNQSPTSSPASAPPSTSASSSTPQQKENIRSIVVFHMRVRSTASEEAMLKSVQTFLKGLKIQQCEDCSIRVKYH